MLEFIEDGGYSRPELWGGEGWAWRAREGVDMPRYWERSGGGYAVRSFAQERRSTPRSRCATCRGTRPTPTRAGRASACRPRPNGRRPPPGTRRRGDSRPQPWGSWPANERVANLDQLAFGCAPSGAYAGGESACGMRQAAGDVWEWTSSGIRGLPRLSRVPLPRVLGGVLRRPVPGPARRLLGDAAGRRLEHLPQLGPPASGARYSPASGARRTWRSGVTRATAEHGPEPVRIDVHLREGALASFAEDVRSGLGSDPKAIPPKYFYDARGSELFEQITEPCPSTTRRGPSSRSWTRRVRRSSSGCGRPRSSSSGPGSARKTDALLRPMVEGGCGTRYVPVDVSESFVEQCARRLADAVRGPRDPRPRGRLRAPPRPDPAQPPAAG